MFIVKQEIPTARVADLLCSGMEGGIGYWGQIVDYVTPIDYPNGPMDFRFDAKQLFRHIDFPLNPGGAVILEITEAGEVTDEKVFVLTLDKLEAGLTIMAAKYPRHFANFMAQNEDAETGDVFIQCALFGETVFG